MSADGLLMILQSLISFFTRIGYCGIKAFQTLTRINEALLGSDAPAFGLDDPSLFLAFGNPSIAKLYQASDGKNFVLLRFQ